MWPALVRLAGRFRRSDLARVWSEHTASGAHRARRMPFPNWVTPKMKAEARALSDGEAEAILAPLLEARHSR
jgi:hypothetical protein